MRKIIIICGPTASGKTRVGIELAKKFGGEIISADSGAVWRGFDIGTAKLSAKDGYDIPHHLIDTLNPDEHFDAARFVAFADEAIADIIGRGRVPFVVGGAGMYIKMLVNGMCEAPPQDQDYRKEIEKRIEENGIGAAHSQLEKIDPESAANISPNDRTRVIRALEIHHLTGMRASEFRKQHGFGERRYDALKIGLTVDRAELYRRIDERVDDMIRKGLVDEVRILLSKYPSDCQPFSAVGYREIVAHIKGECSLDEATRLTKQNSRHFAKRQMTWFRADSEIRWFGSKQHDDMVSAVWHFLH